jgi:hypothetical protein
MAEHLIVDQEVAGSSPVSHPTFKASQCGIGKMLCWDVVAFGAVCSQPVAKVQHLSPLWRSYRYK